MAFRLRATVFVALLGLCSCGGTGNGTAGAGGAAATGGAGGVGGVGGVGGIAPTGCPTTLDTLTNWFETPADTDIRGFSSIDASITFQNITGRSIDVDDTQLWSVPNDTKRWCLRSKFAKG